MLHPGRQVQAEVQVGVARDYPPARGTHHVTLLDEVGLEDVLDGMTLLADRRSQAVHADRTAIELLDQVSSRRRSW